MLLFIIVCGAIWTMTEKHTPITTLVLNCAFTLEKCQYQRCLLFSYVRYESYIWFSNTQSCTRLTQNSIKCIATILRSFLRPRNIFCRVL
ncbi:hypothetical protein SRHO_G00058370 [Serrasalmus rhombeus]